MRFKAWFAGLDIGSKVFLIFAAVVVAPPLLLTGAAVPLVAMSALFPSTPPDARAAPLTLVDNASEDLIAPAVPVTTTAEVTETSALPFVALSIDDATLPLGTNAVTTVGTPGSLERLYRVTYVDGVESSRELISETVTVAPVDEVTSVGTYVAPPPVASNCDSNYADGCVPIASDVDCAGGSGNGPAYVSGIVRVTGSDIYDLDRDGDGYGCD